MSDKHGVTVLELLVAITAFTILVGVATGALITVIRAQRQAVIVASIQGNASVVLEAMAKEIRTGNTFSVPVPPGVICTGFSSGCTEGPILAFTNRKGQSITYATSSVSQITRQIDGNSPEPITANRIIVTSLKFKAQGVGVGDQRQPLITIMITLQGVGTKPEQNIAVNVQTSIAPRELEL